MTIDEAIKHCEEVAEKLEKKANIYEIKNTYLPDSQKPVDCLSCAADHRQLAEWLTKLKEAKRLLKLALQDLAEAEHCDLCKYEADDIATCQRKPINCFVWRYADEALKLLND